MKKKEGGISLSSAGPVVTQVRTLGHRPGLRRTQKLLNTWSETRAGGRPLSGQARGLEQAFFFSQVKKWVSQFTPNPSWSRACGF